MRDELHDGETIKDAIKCLMSQKPKPSYRWLDFLLTGIYLTIYVWILVKIFIWLKSILFG
jgi:hypothetical protein